MSTPTLSLPLPLPATAFAEPVQPGGAFCMGWRELAEVVAAQRTAASLGADQARVFGVATDVWTLKPGDAFFTVDVPNNENRSWVQAAIQRGATVIVTDQTALCAATLTVPVVLVGDLWRAMAALTKAHRQTLRGRFVAVSDAGFDGSVIGKFLIQALGGSAVARPWRPTPTATDLLRAVIDTHDGHCATVLDFSRVAPSLLPSLTAAVQPQCAVLAAPNGEIAEPERNQAWLCQATTLLKSLGKNTAAVVDFDSLACLMASKAAAHGTRLISYGSDWRCEFRATGFALGREGISFRVGGLPTGVATAQQTHWRGRQGDRATHFHMPSVAQSHVGAALAAIAVGWWAGQSLAEVAQNLNSSADAEWCAAEPRTERAATAEPERRLRIA